jgi:hypothetical protein
MGQLTDIIEEMESIRDLLGNAPEINGFQRRKFTIDRLEKFFDDCDLLNDAVDKAFGRLDDLTIKIGEVE